MNDFILGMLHDIQVSCWMHGRHRGCLIDTRASLGVTPWAWMSPMTRVEACVGAAGLISNTPPTRTHMHTQDTVRELAPIPDVAFMLHTGDNARSTNGNLFDAGEEADTQRPPNAWATEAQPPPDTSQRNVPLPVRCARRRARQSPPVLVSCVGAKPWVGGAESRVFMLR